MFQDDPSVTGIVIFQPCALLDRKSTRLNSSHLVISYAVFCLKKKKYHIVLTRRVCPARAAGRPGGRRAAAPVDGVPAFRGSPPGVPLGTEVASDFCRRACRSR